MVELKDEVLLLLYALKRQAADGACKDPKPWGWNSEESTKWHAWSSLGAMSPVEAMRLYVRSLEEEMVRPPPPAPQPAPGKLELFVRVPSPQSIRSGTDTC